MMTKKESDPVLAPFAKVETSRCDVPARVQRAEWKCFAPLNLALGRRSAPSPPVSANPLTWRDHLFFKGNNATLGPICRTLSRGSIQKNELGGPDHFVPGGHRDPGLESSGGDQRFDRPQFYRHDQQHSRTGRH